MTEPHATDATSGAELALSTRLVHIGEDASFGAGVRPLSPPLHHAAIWEAESAELLGEIGRGSADRAFYGRYGHPNARQAEEAVALLERAPAALVFSTGMSALTTTWDALLAPGDVVVLVGPIYGGTEMAAKRAARWGIEIRRAPIDEPASWPALFRGARLVHTESISNPTLRVPDLETVARAARAAGALSMVDATFASPILQRPLALGIDLSMHSATKFLGGHSDLLGGTIAGSAELLARIATERKILGTILAPEPSWRLLRSIKTLELRMARVEATRRVLCEHLRTIARVRRVLDPLHPSHPDHAVAVRLLRGGAGGIVTFELEDERAAARCLDRLRLFHRAASLGGSESLASMPALTSHAALTPEQLVASGIHAGCIRLAIGLEDAEDLWRDLRQALEVV
ncbi:MAG: PLP-dependent transferase [Planctomycetes bacterium]|nr:PLP-dependent transferase [Planctomycetota bacterium]